jgi:glycosyltransferase involved in cell wall biosynthesis
MRGEIMKILQINLVNGSKSTGRTTIELTDYLNSNGHQAYVACSFGLGKDYEYQIGTSIGKRLHSLFSRIFGNQGYYSKFSTSKLIKYIDELKPDVVHLRNLHGNYINLNILFDYISRKNLPTVITLHDTWFYTGKCCFYTEANCFKWQKECGNCPQLRRDNPSWFVDKTKSNLLDKKNWLKNIPRLAVIGVSDWITDESRKSILKSANIIYRIYNWIDLDEFQPVESFGLRSSLGLEEQFIIIGVASKWGERKGLSSFIELSQMISDKMKIILIGKIEDKFTLPSNIISIPETHSKKELAQYYSLADVFITFSKEESFGKVTAEALACGTPAIVYDSTANSEIVSEECGYVVDSGNIKKVVEKIKEIELRGKKVYSDNCRKFVTKNFNKEDRIKDYLEIYNKIINY